MSEIQCRLSLDAQEYDHRPKGVRQKAGSPRVSDKYSWCALINWYDVNNSLVAPQGEHMKQYQKTKRHLTPAVTDLAAA